jgi:hypothetical protein
MYDLYQGVEISTAAKSTYSNYYNGSSELIGGSGPKGPPGENGNFSKDELCIFSKLGMSLTGFGKNWVANTPNLLLNIKEFSVVSLSASGKYQTAITETDQNIDTYLYVSSDFGNTWNGVQSIPKIKLKSVSLSASGQYQTVVGIFVHVTLDAPPIVGDFIYVSSDFGVTWTKSNSLQNYWTSVSLSASGQYQTAVGIGILEGESPPPGDFIYVSSDFGTSWTKSNSLQNYWRSVSLSASGQYQTAVGMGIPNQGPPGDIYVSSDFGTSWTSISLQKIFTSVSLSASGQYQTAVAENDDIYISNDFGISWTSVSLQKKWTSVSLSASGQYQAVVAQDFSGDYIYVSIDFGNTWTPSNSPEKTWQGVSVSGSGQHITACYYEPNAPNVYIYTSKSFPPQP